MSTLIRNAMVTPDGTWLQSRTRHDYVEHTDANGSVYMVDGGLDYVRRSVNAEAPAIDKCVYDDSPHAEQREAVTWGTYGKTGEDPLKHVTVAEMDTDHLEAVLETQQRLYPQTRKVMMDELEYRISGLGHRG